MKQKLAKILEYRWHVILGSICLFLAISFGYMYADQYHLNKEENKHIAAEKNQRALLDLKTGEVIVEYKDIIPISAIKEIKEEKVKLANKKETEISIIISDLGLNGNNAKAAMKFPENVAFSFNPYPEASLKLSQKATAAGHVVLSRLPMDKGTADGEKPGLLELNEAYSEFRNIQNIEASLSKVFSPKAVIMPMKEIFSSSAYIGAIVNELARKNLSIIYLGENQEKLARLTSESGNKLIIPDVVINDLVSEAEVRAKLKDFENISKDKGHALLVVKPFPITLSIVKEWLKIAPQKTLKLVPVKL